MTTPVWFDVFLDVPRATFPTSVAFWSAATGWLPSPVRGEHGQFLTVLPPHGTPWVKMQAVDGGPRLHLDVASRDRPGLHERALALGAEPAWQYEDVPVLRSPGGLLLCLTLAGDDTRMRRGTPSSILDQVCLDIPPRVFDAEVAFWRDLTGRELTTGRYPHFARLVDPRPDAPLRFLLQRVDDDRPHTTAHPDLAVADRAHETERHLALGAELVGAHEAWTVLRAPDGLVYCLTDRDPRTGLPLPHI